MEQGKGMQHLKIDFHASMMVFLVAVTLCPGIALASGTPMFFGVIAGIIGGVLVGVLSGLKFGEAALQQD